MNQAPLPRCVFMTHGLGLEPKWLVAIMNVVSHVKIRGSVQKGTHRHTCAQLQDT